MVLMFGAPPIVGLSALAVTQVAASGVLASMSPEALARYEEAQIKVKRREFAKTITGQQSGKFARESAARFEELEGSQCPECGKKDAIFMWHQPEKTYFWDWHCGCMNNKE